MNPKLSVIIPTKDRPQLLARALASVRAQTFKDFEAIVVDDGDESVEAAVVSFGDLRVRYIKNEGLHGGGAARNLGAREAQGVYLAFLDDDDEWLPEKLALQVAALDSAAPKTAFCFSSVVNAYDGREEITQVPEGQAQYLENALARFSGFLTSTLVMKNSVFTELGGFDETLPSHQEPDLIIRASEKYDGIGINRPLVRVDMSGGREHIGGVLARRIAGRRALLQKHLPLFVTRPRILAKHYFRLGLWNRDSGDQAEARRYFRRALCTFFTLRYAAHYLRALVYIF